MQTPLQTEDEFAFREATAEDNRSLLELARQCPMQSDIALSIEREPDFFALSRARGDGLTLVAESRGQVVGCAGVCRRTAYLNGRPGIMGYVGDIKVAPAMRRRGLAQRMLDELARRHSELPPAPYVGLTGAGNAAVDGLLLRFGRDNPLRRVGTFTSYQLLPLFSLRVDDRYEIHRAGSSDRAELVDLLDRYHRTRTFAPIFINGGLGEVLQRTPGMVVESYLIARNRGRLAAALAVWNEAGVKQTRVRRLTRPLRLVSLLVAAAGKVLPVPPFPVEGELLRFSYLRHQAHAPGEERALGALVRQAVNQARGLGQHFVMLTCPQDDPVRRCLAGVPKTTYRYSMVVGTNSPGFGDELARFEGGRLYDDAALA